MRGKHFYPNFKDEEAVTVIAQDSIDRKWKKQNLNLGLYNSKAHALLTAFL